MGLHVRSLVGFAACAPSSPCAWRSWQSRQLLDLPVPHRPPEGCALGALGPESCLPDHILPLLPTA